MEDYYKKQLEKLSGDLSVKFFSESGDTKILNVNNDSINAIIAFLETLKTKKIDV